MDKIPNYAMDLSEIQKQCKTNYLKDAPKLKLRNMNGMQSLI
jgi:hypothetical protein